MRQFILSAFAIFIILPLTGSDTIRIENDKIRRTILIDSGKINTIDFVSKEIEYDFHRLPSVDFSFKIKGEEISGSKGYFSIEMPNKEGNKTTILHLTGMENSPANNIEMKIHYEAPRGTAGIRKWFSLRNKGQEDILISDICVENLNLDPWGGSNSVIHANWGRDFFKPPYSGDQEDPAIFLKGQKGTIILGNEAPGMTKFTGIYTEESPEIKIGMRQSTDPYAVKMRLKPGEEFESPETFILFSPAGNHAAGVLKEFIRDHMDVVMLDRKEYPAFFYNTWSPFRTNINEELIREIADNLEGTGAGYLIIDDGWQNNMGDWEADPERFPSGMRNISEYIRSKGLKPGIWFSLCSVEKKSDAFEIHEDNTIKNIKGEPDNLHGNVAGNRPVYTMNILSTWYDHIMNKTIMMIEDYGFEYFKIDLGFIKSAYITDPKISGSYRDNDPESRFEFYYPAYQRLLTFFDELKAKYPHVIFDCTYELWGDHHSIDYALIQHADVDWISNFFDDPPEGSREVRTLAYHQGNIIPTACMMIGNQQMDVPNHQFSFISGFSGIPMMLGDPRNLSNEEKAWYRRMANWFTSMQEKYNIMPYYQTRGFEPPSEFNWDGFTRINPESGGGIICVFRNNSPDTERNILVKSVLRDGIYRIINTENNLLGDYAGEELIEAGFSVKIPEPHSAMVFEIQRIK